MRRLLRGAADAGSAGGVAAHGVEHPNHLIFETYGWVRFRLTFQSIIGKYFLISFLLIFFTAPYNTW